ncbi:S1C family serine protease [Melissospora conviva]|uniref:S1C family serine protease n=1 Tax=Melissospora conviva TaxID=3388432 RepID=UPI003B7FB460
MAVQTGLGEPRGPWFLSPEMEGDSAGRTGGQQQPDEPSRRRWLLSAVAVIALSTVAGGLAGGVTGSQEQPEAAPAAGAGISPQLIEAAEKTVPGVVSVLVQGGSGSGFAIDGEQHIVTNDHIVERAGGGTVVVETSAGRRLAAEVVGRDPASDIAVLQVPASTGLTPLPLAKPGTTRVGESVLAVGSPLGLSGTVTAGIVSALDRQVRLRNSRHTAVQTDASINPGNSGGPLVNTRGEVVGVNTAIATLDGNGSIGIGFAIPIDQVQQTADTIIGKGG